MLQQLREFVAKVDDFNNRAELFASTFEAFQKDQAAIIETGVKLGFTKTDARGMMARISGEVTMPSETQPTAPVPEALVDVPVEPKADPFPPSDSIGESQPSLPTTQPPPEMPVFLQREAPADPAYEEANKKGSEAIKKINAATSLEALDNWLKRNSPVIDKFPIDIATTVYQEAGARRKALGAQP